jgi:hypothetical protein
MELSRATVFVACCQDDFQIKLTTYNLGPSKNSPVNISSLRNNVGFFFTPGVGSCFSTLHDSFFFFCLHFLSRKVCMTIRIYRGLEQYSWNPLPCAVTAKTCWDKRVIRQLNHIEFPWVKCCGISEKCSVLHMCQLITSHRSSLPSISFVSWGNGMTFVRKYVLSLTCRKTEIATPNIFKSYFSIQVIIVSSDYIVLLSLAQRRNFALYNKC